MATLRKRQRIWLVLVLVLMGWSSRSAGEQRAVVHPDDSGAEIANPGMGWIFPYYDNSLNSYGSRLEPSDTVDDFPCLAVIQLRIAWSFVEPNEGDFNWSMLDAPAQRWIDKGKQIAIRITCSEPGMVYATPKWVRDAGAQGYLSTWGEWEPDFDDPVFLGKLDAFLAALAARYDGSPDVAFVDVGSFGGWGEGHTFATSRRTYPCSTVCKHIDLHLKHFRHTLLTANDDFAFQGDEPIDFELRKHQGMEIILYALDKGLALRDDSILVEGGENAYHNADMAQLFWPTVPVIIESCHYGLRRDQQIWGDGMKYLEALEDYHASYASIHWWPREFLGENRELVRQMNLRMGYRLQITEASWPTQLPIVENATLRLAAKWRNAGVAPCLPGGHPTLTLKDADGGIVGVFVDQGFDVRSLPVGPPGQAEVRSQEATFVLRPPLIHIPFPGAPLPADPGIPTPAPETEPPPASLRPGTYGVYISVGTRAGTPRIALPLPNDDGNGRYRLGTLEAVSSTSLLPEADRSGGIVLFDEGGGETQPASGFSAFLLGGLRVSESVGGDITAYRGSVVQRLEWERAAGAADWSLGYSMAGDSDAARCTDLGDVEALHFAFHPGNATGTYLTVIVDGGVFSALPAAPDSPGISLDQHEWQVVEIPLEALRPAETDPMAGNELEGKVWPGPSVIFRGDLSGIFYMDDIRLTRSTQTVITGAGDSALPPGGEQLRCYPNPFNGTTRLSFAVTEARHGISLDVFDVLGRRVRSLTVGALPEGTHTLSWDGRDDSGTDVASGVYVARLVGADGTRSRAMTLLR